MTPLEVGQGKPVLVLWYSGGLSLIERETSTLIPSGFVLLYNDLDLVSYRVSGGFGVVSASLPVLQPVKKPYRHPSVRATRDQALVCHNDTMGTGSRALLTRGSDRVLDLLGQDAILPSYLNGDLRMTQLRRPIDV